MPLCESTKSMVKSNLLFLLLSVYAALVATCMGSRIGFTAVAATATATNVVNRGATCGPESDQPRCDDPSPYERGKGEVDGAHQPTNTSSEDRAFCDSDEGCKDGQQQQRRQQRQQQHRRPPVASSAGGSVRRAVQPGRFQSGDVIELYNTESRDIQIVFPSLVKGRDPGNPSGGYRVTKTTDGKDVENIPDRHMHMYVPYGRGDEALCNIGEFKPARPIIVRCTVLDYSPAASRGAMVLQGTYDVRVHATRANEEYETNLPVWKLQRRYLAAAS